MLFEQLEIDSYFKFTSSPIRIYKKINEFQCVRFLKEFPVWEDALVTKVSENEVEREN